MQQSGRMRMRLWLEEQIESGKYPGVSWLDKSARIFQIPWKHAARQGWSIDRDATLFRSWAVHTGRYRPGKNKPDPKTWKANFRCALNSLPDVCELPEYSKKRGSNAYRVYKMLPSTQTHRRRRGLRLVSRSRELQGSSRTCPPAGTGSVHTWQHRTPFSDNVETKAEDVMFNTHTGMWEARTEPEDPEQNEAIFKLMDQLSSADVWNQAGGQRGWRTHTLWDHCHCPADESLCSLQTDNYNELFTPNYTKDVSDWSTYQLML